MSETPRSEREQFEKWAQEPPREWAVRMFPADFAVPQWLGRYFNYHVQCAWEAWQAAHDASNARIAQLEDEVRRLSEPEAEPELPCCWCGRPTAYRDDAGQPECLRADCVERRG